MGAVDLMPNEHGYCPNCNADLDGDPIWHHFYNEFREKGDWHDAEGRYIGTRRILSPEDAAVAADRVAADYGATQGKGKFGRQIGIYSLEADRTVRWRCPDCDHEWSRK